MPYLFFFSSLILLWIGLLYSFVYISFAKHMHYFTLNIYSGVELFNLRDTHILTFFKVICFTFTSPSAIFENSSCPNTKYHQIFSCSPFDEYIVVFHWYFNLHVPNSQWGWAPFHISSFLKSHFHTFAQFSI